MRGIKVFFVFWLALLAFIGVVSAVPATSSQVLTEEQFYESLGIHDHELILSTHVAAECAVPWNKKVFAKRFASNLAELNLRQKIGINGVKALVQGIVGKFPSVQGTDSICFDLEIMTQIQNALGAMHYAMSSIDDYDMTAEQVAQLALGIRSLDDEIDFVESVQKRVKAEKKPKSNANGLSLRKRVAALKAQDLASRDISLDSVNVSSRVEYTIYGYKYTSMVCYHCGNQVRVNDFTTTAANCPGNYPKTYYVGCKSQYRSYPDAHINRAGIDCYLFKTAHQDCYFSYVAVNDPAAGACKTWQAFSDKSQRLVRQAYLYTNHVWEVGALTALKFNDPYWLSNYGAYNIACDTACRAKHSGLVQREVDWFQWPYNWDTMPPAGYAPSPYSDVLYGHCDNSLYPIEPN